MKSKKLLLTLTASTGLFAAIAFAAEHSKPSDMAAEMKAFHEKALAAYDVDKNGTLDQDERAVLHDHIRSGKFPIPAAVRHHIAQAIGHGTKGHHGEAVKLSPDILAKYDTNKDGKLDEKEHVAFAVDIAAGKVQPPHPRHHAPAPDGSGK
jgi:hypothetical protein